MGARIDRESATCEQSTHTLLPRDALHEFFMAQRLAPFVDDAEIIAADELSRFERLLSELSAGFINLPADRIDEVIDSSLRRIVETLHIDRCSMTRVLPDRGHFQTLHSHAAEGFSPAPRNSSRAFPWAFERFRAGEALVFSHPDELPAEAELDREGYRAAGFGSHVGQPIMVAGQLFGVLGFGSLRYMRRWPDALVTRMRLLAEIYGNALARKQSQAELDRALGFERLASRLLASRLMAGAGHDAGAIEAALGDIGRFLSVDRVALWRRLPRQPAFAMSHGWSVDGSASSLLDGAEADAQPWFVAQLLAGAPVLLQHEEPWPAAARAELRTRDGLRSLLAVPFSTGGEVAGALCCANIAGGRRWPEALVPGAGLLAEVFASLHARQAAERRGHAAELEAALWRERLAHMVRVHTAGELSAALAHEINQPLGAIENYALAARRRIHEPVPDLARVASLLDKLYGQAIRAGNVVTRMRGLVQQHAVEPKELDVEQAVRSCVDMLRMDCELREIRVEMHVEQALPAAQADEVHLQQVILNLLRNAMEACEVPRAIMAREVVIELAHGGPEAILIRVADRGAGIAEDGLERVFESFYSTKPNGLGVGLAICRRLVEAHGGALWATHNPGGGAVFHCRLPVAGSD